METRDTGTSRRADSGQIVIGLIILSIGAMLLLDRLSPGTDALHAWWPFVLIVMGAARVAESSDRTRRCGGKRRSGVWLIVVGLWGLVNEWRVFGLTYGTSWPLLVMASGALMVWRSLDDRTDAATTRER